MRCKEGVFYKGGKALAQGGQEMVDASFLETDWRGLSAARSSGKCSCTVQRGCITCPSKVPSKPNHSIYLDLLDIFLYNSILSTQGGAAF